MIEIEDETEELEIGELSPGDRQLLESAARGLKDCARILGTWREYQEYCKNYLSLHDLIISRIEKADRRNKLVARIMKRKKDGRAS